MKLNTHTISYRQTIHRVRKGFTLIELLVVIAIIAVLASISYGPIMGYINKGKITEVRKVCSDIEIAVDQFKSEYTYLPYTGSHPSDDTNYVTDTEAGVAFLKVLMGQDSSVNDKEITYFSAKRAKSSKNGLLYTGSGDAENITALKDHWANPYTIRLDYNGDGKIDTKGINSNFSGIQNKEVISATPGNDRTWREGEDITSW